MTDLTEKNLENVLLNLTKTDKPITIKPTTWFGNSAKTAQWYTCPKPTGEEHMTPKFTQLLEQCITDGVILGHKRAYKHNDAPSESDINQSIVTEVLNEIHEWFDFDEPKERNT